MKPNPTLRTVTSRRELLRAGATVSGTALLGLAATSSATAAPGKPDFSPRVWGDGEPWGTKVTGEIRRPNERSLDKFFVVTTAEGVEASLPAGQAPVSDAAPGNPAYNGGRWWTHVATWTEAGQAAHGTSLPLLTRYGPASDPESIRSPGDRGHIDISEGAPPDGPPDYFRCPLLPVKED
jgi:hypothetical protein